MEMLRICFVRCFEKLTIFDYFLMVSTMVFPSFFVCTKLKIENLCATRQVVVQNTLLHKTSLS